jgi:hypothetical protein
MNISKYKKATFLKKENCPIALTISGAEAHDYSRHAGKEDWKIIIDTEERFRVSLNQTNLETIAQLFGNETDDWIGQRIGFVWDPTVQMNDEAVGGIRAVPVEKLPKVPTLKRKLTPLQRAGRQVDEDGEQIPF